jgi:hypothetical protein
MLKTLLTCPFGPGSYGAKSLVAKPVLLQRERLALTMTGLLLAHSSERL